MSATKRTIPWVTPEAQNLVLSPVFTITKDTSDVTVRYLDLSAWAGKFIALTFIGEQGWIAFSPAASGSYAVTSSVLTAVTETNTNSMYPVPDGVEKQMVVSAAFPFLAYITPAGAATLSVHRA